MTAVPRFCPAGAAYALPMTVSRRHFLLGALASACVRCSGGDGDGPGHGFGGGVDIGSRADVSAAIDDGDGFLHVPEARAWVVRYPSDRLAEAGDVYDDRTLAGLDAGLIALYQKCPHLGCRVPACATSKRFECPCHGSIFNRVGEWVDGPARRGMDRFAIVVDGDRVSIDTAVVLDGLDRGVSTVDGEPAGPVCIVAPN
jgi:cytochrome b6-f complex iron-sulfur subunit